MFWSEIGPGFEQRSGTPLARIARITPRAKNKCYFCRGLLQFFIPRSVTLAEYERGFETAYNLSTLIIAKFTKVPPTSRAGRDLLAW